MYDVFPIPVPPSEADIDHYIAINLNGLKLDPTSFRSSYEDAVKRPRKAFIRRIDSPNIVTLISREKETGEWVAMAAFQAGLDAKLPASVVEEGSKTFLFAALWVHPEHRRKGLARAMFERGLEWVKEYPLEGLGKLAAVEVYSDNPARELYKSLGLVEKEEREREGRLVKYLSMVVE